MRSMRSGIGTSCKIEILDEFAQFLETHCLSFAHRWGGTHSAALLEDKSPM